MRHAWLAIAALMILGGCSRVVKQRTTLSVPPAILQARTASLEELVELINLRYAGIQTLKVSNFEVEFQGGSVEEGYLEKYPRGKGYLVAEKPASIFVNILNPLTSSTIATMSAQGDAFEIWLPRENKFVVGNTTVQLEEKNPLYNVRPDHLLNGIIVEKVPTDQPYSHYFLEEEQDATAKYYVLGVVRVNPQEGGAHLERRLWIERSRMQLVRQRYYDEGRLISSIEYGEPYTEDDLLLNRRVRIERVRENYTISLLFDAEGISLNEPIREGAFDIPQPPGAELVVVEKKPEGEQTGRE